jgi:hypothetical protein
MDGLNECVLDTRGSTMGAAVTQCARANTLCFSEERWKGGRIALSFPTVCEQIVLYMRAQTRNLSEEILRPLRTDRAAAENCQSRA